MASLRPASRLLTRQLTRFTTKPQTTLHRPLQILTTSPTTTSIRRSNLHTTRTLNRDDDTFGQTGRRPANSGATNPNETRKIPSSPAASATYTDGPPSQPKPGESLPSGISPSTIYTFDDIKSITSSPDSHPNTILIDVREPSELLETGRIPGARNVPVKTAADAFFLSAEDFEDKFGWERPGEEKEVVFYCRSGVRSKAAARLAGQAGFGGKISEFPGSWLEWAEKGGEVQKE